MEKKPNKRIRPNLFDIIVICVILVAAAGVYVISHRDVDTAADTTQVVYTVEISRLPEGTSEYLEVGQTMKDNINSCPAGEITDIQVQPYVIQTTNKETGVVEDKAVAGYETLLITLKADGTVSDHNISINGTTALRIGGRISYSNGSFTGSGYVVSMER